MDIITILIALGLAMDCFSVSVTNGLANKQFKLNDALKVASFFGGFQAMMSAFGWLAGYSLIDYISGFDHWIAFGLLIFIGCRMIYETTKKESRKFISSLSTYVLLVLAVATSIDALAVGLSLSFLRVPILMPATIIGIVALCLSFLGVYIGHKFASIFENKIEFAGGIILIGIGLKILLDHLAA